MHIAVAILLSLTLIASPARADAQPAARAHVGILANVHSPSTEAFRQGLRDLGYVEGQNVVLEWRLAEGKLERLPELAADLVRLNVDVILAPAPPYVSAAKKSTSTIPIVFALVPDPVEMGFVQSLGRPGGNATGLANNAFELGAKRLQLLKEAIPGVAGIGVLTNARTEVGLRDVERAADSLGIARVALRIARPEDIDQAFAQMKGMPRSAIVEVGNSPIAYAHRQRISDLALQNGIPTMCSAPEFVDAGCLFYYGASLPDLMRRSAQYVHKILMGAKPADLPVEQPTKYEFFVNLKTAKALGLTIPSALLLRADHVVQ